MITSLKLSFAAASLVCGTVFVTAEVVRPEPAPLQEPEGMDPAMMAKMMEAMAPGEEHKALCAKAGKWHHDMDMTMPGMPPTKTTMTSTVETLLGGRFTLARYEGSMMEMPFEAIHICGFDNLTGEHVQIWMDSMGTTPVVSRGKRGDDGKIVLRGLMRDFATPEGRPYHSIHWENEDGTETMEMYDSIPPQGEVKVMTVTSKRVE